MNFEGESMSSPFLSNSGTRHQLQHQQRPIHIVASSGAQFVQQRGQGGASSCFLNNILGFIFACCERCASNGYFRAFMDSSCCETLFKLLCFILLGLLASQILSFVLSTASSIVTLFFLRQTSAMRSSSLCPFLPFYIPTFQFLRVSWWHVPIFVSQEYRPRND